MRLLGGCALTVGSGAETRPRSRKVRALLGWLAVHRPHATPRERLAELLWPEREPNEALHCLRQAIYELRGALGAGGARLLEANALELRLLASDDLAIDLDRLASAPGEADAELPEDETVELCRGDLLEGLMLPGCAEFEIWLERERARWRDLAAGALARLAARSGAAGLAAAHRLVEIEPLSESAGRLLIRRLRDAGDRDGALREIRRLRGALARELGIGLESETEALGAELAGSGRSPSGPSSGGAAFELPWIENPIPLAWLAREHSLAASGPRRSYLRGPAGAGKSRLLAEFLRRMGLESGPLPCEGLQERCWVATLAGGRRSASGPPRDWEVVLAPLDAECRGGEVHDLALWLEPQIAHLALALVDSSDAARVTRFLIDSGAALPWAAAEALAWATEIGGLVPSEGRRWRWRPLPRGEPGPVSLADSVRRRLALLPRESRRLLALAAVVGPRFTAQHLARAEGESPAVIAAALDTLVARGMVRPLPSPQPARQANYEFTPRGRAREVVASLPANRLEVLAQRVRETVAPSKEPASCLAGSGPASGRVDPAAGSELSTSRPCHRRRRASPGPCPSP